MDTPAALATSIRRSGGTWFRRVSLSEASIGADYRAAFQKRLAGGHGVLVLVVVHDGIVVVDDVVLVGVVVALEVVELVVVLRGPGIASSTAASEGPARLSSKLTVSGARNAAP